MELRKIYVLIISAIFFAGTTPLVLAASEDSVIITFDPEGDIDIDVSLASYNFTNVTANEWKNTSGGTFTLYNNGSNIMDTQIKTNATTEETDMTLDGTGTPETDEYSIYIKSLDNPGFVTSAYGSNFDDDLGSNDNKFFDICLLIGTNLTANHSWQTTTIYFQGSQG